MKLNAKVSFYFHGRAVEIPVGEVITIHLDNGSEYTGILQGFGENRAGRYVKLAGDALTFPAGEITAADWKGTRYADKKAAIA